MADKVKYGVRKVHYAVLTETEQSGSPVYTYATPVPIPGAVSLSFDAAGDDSPFYADDMVYFRAAANNGYTGNMEVAYFPDAFYKDVFGETLDATDKVLTESKGVQAKHVALLFEEEGDADGTKFLFYEVIFSRPNRSLSTTNESITPQTQTVNFSAIPRSDSKIKVITTPDTPSGTLSAWYSSVWEA